jgi:hypothetical protein
MKWAINIWEGTVLCSGACSPGEWAFHGPVTRPFPPGTGNAGCTHSGMIFFSGQLTTERTKERTTHTETQPIRRTTIPARETESVKGIPREAGLRTQQERKRWLKKIQQQCVVKLSCSHPAGSRAEFPFLLLDPITHPVVKDQPVEQCSNSSSMLHWRLARSTGRRGRG